MGTFPKADMRGSRVPEHIPRDIRPKLFAANSALGGALDQWAVLSGNTTVLVFPLANSALADAAEFREGLLRTEYFGGFVDGIHVDPV